MAGARFTRIILNRADLRRPFPPGFVHGLRGQTVRALTRRGKYLVAELSSGRMLVMHLGMSGSFRVEPTRAVARRPPDPDAALERRHDHVVFTMSSGKTVTFNDPRRFGVMDLVDMTAVDGETTPAPLRRLGPEPLSRGFDARALARRLRGRRVAIKVALLDQRVAAGIGNIYASEALHLARISPRRSAASLVARDGAPRPACVRLAAAIKAVLRRAIALKESDRYRASRFRVYDREGAPCPTPGCRGTIVRVEQAGRATFYCPVCQV
jgi:formamidopyrimidine-DNA glycosylase